MHLNTANGYWYLRRNTGDGKETVAKLGKHAEQPKIYRPELVQDKAENVLGRIPTGCVDVALTDPPYGIDFESGASDYNGAAGLGGLMNDTTLDFLPDVAADLYRVLADDSHLYVFTRWDVLESMRDPFLEAGFDLKRVLVWDKKGHGMGDLSTWAPGYENILYFVKGSPELRGKRPRDVLRFTGMNTGKVQNSPWQIHPTQKPRDLLEYIIRKSSDVGDLVVDPFGGSYATARAAQRTFRRCVACELDPETHRAAVGLTEKEFQKDPEYGVDWSEVTNLDVVETSTLRDAPAAASDD